VTFTCSTHSEGGVTTKDLRLAHQIEQEFARRSG
jgi:pterin-4a-carbinolamine dehydratase